MFRENGYLHHHQWFHHCHCCQAHPAEQQEEKEKWHMSAWPIRKPKEAQLLAPLWLSNSTLSGIGVQEQLFPGGGGGGGVELGILSYNIYNILVGTNCWRILLTSGKKKKAHKTHAPMLSGSGLTAWGKEKCMTFVGVTHLKAHKPTENTTCGTTFALKFYSFVFRNHVYIAGNICHLSQSVVCWNMSSWASIWTLLLMRLWGILLLFLNSTTWLASLLL